MVLGLKLENSPWDGMKSEGKFSLLMKLENSPVVIMSRDWLHSWPQLGCSLIWALEELGPKWDPKYDSNLCFLMAVLHVPWFNPYQFNSWCDTGYLCKIPASKYAVSPEAIWIEVCKEVYFDKHISEHILNLFGAFRIQFKHLVDDEVSYSPSIIEKSQIGKKR